ASVVHRPARTGAPGAPAAVGSSVSETMYERPAAFTPVTIRRTFPGMSVLLFIAAPRPAGPLPATTCGAHLRTIARSGDLDVEQRRVSRSRLLQRQSHQRVRAGLSVEIAARGDDLLELRRRDRQPRNDLADAPRLLVEVPDELAPGGLLRVALAVLREDRDARAEERHLVRWDQLQPLPEVEHLG